MSKKKSRESVVTDQKSGDKSPKDKSEFVYQGERLPIELNIREFPWTEKQKDFIEIALHKNTNYMFCKAPAGVGKTLLSVYVGLKLLNEGKIKNIYFCRQPVESSSYGLGFLSGDLDAKMSPYSHPMMDHLNELLPPAQINKLLQSGFIQSIPVGFLKGRTFNNSLIIADEAEDFLAGDFRLVMGRLGKYSKMLLIGDENQVNVKNSAFLKVFDLFNSEECQDNGIYCLSFTSKDIMRNKILGYVIDRFVFLK
jgi:phosphate starvation-inducible PhoH-like protein